VINLAFIEGDFAYSLLLGILAAVNPCGFVLLPTYLLAYLSVADDSPTHVRVRRALTVGGSVSLGFLAVFLVVGVISRLFTAWIEMNAKYAALFIGIALIVLGVRMLRGWKPRLWVPALSGNAGSRGVRSMATFGVVYAVASIGCTLGLLTTAVLGSFARHGVVSGVASVAMYGLGMGVFVTALTVTLAFTKCSTASRAHSSSSRASISRGIGTPLSPAVLKPGVSSLGLVTYKMQSLQPLQISVQSRSSFFHFWSS
jgi:cytochrome c biogenesis protein CcdA